MGIRTYAGRKKAGAYTPSWWTADDFARRLGAAVAAIHVATPTTEDLARTCILPDRVEVAIEVLRDETDEQAAERVAAILDLFERAGAAMVQP